jgi:hypothetical protein
MKNKRAKLLVAHIPKHYRSYTKYADGNIVYDIVYYPVSAPRMIKVDFKVGYDNHRTAKR